MKRIALAAILLSLAFSSFGQGTIYFMNSSTTLVMSWNGGSYEPAPNSLNGRIEFYYSTAAASPAVNYSDLAGWLSTTPGTPTPVGVPVPGRFASVTQSADNAIGGSSIWVHARSWTGGYPDWPTALAAAQLDPNSVLLAYSAAWLQPTGNPGNYPPYPPEPMVNGSSGFNGLYLNPLPAQAVPEPSASALTGLSLLSIWFCRRRSGSM